MSIDPLKAVPYLWAGRKTNITRNLQESDVMQYIPKSNLYPPKTDIQVPKAYSGIDRQSVVLDDVKIATKGDGTPRDVTVNGAKVPRQYVVDAMFRNQDFMPRTNQFKLKETPHMFDPNGKKQDSMFNQMPSFPALNMGFDVIRSDGSTDITVASTGGRYEE